MIIGIKNKKADFVAWFFVIVVIMAFSIFALVLNMAWGRVEAPMGDALSNNLPDDSPVNASEILGDVGDSAKTYSNLLPFLIIGLIAFVMILAGSIMKSGIMVFVGIIVLAVLLLLGVIFSNVYTAIADSVSFQSTSDELTIQSLIMEYLPIVITIIALLVGYYLISRNSGGSQSI